ncbi:MAG TPA: helicase-related protein, partial [Chloroflexota bacterium]|nr:helicase-related protein [Chloroflexota bacterium]
MSGPVFNAGPVLAGLKDFQRATVDYVFQRFYLDEPPAKRFLVADEVGLGKTLVAKGLVAKTIEHLQRAGRERIDVVYVCSNGDIARQNVARLSVKDAGLHQFNLPTRITLLPLQLPELKASGVNFVSFTPATSFDLKSRGGTAQERALLYWLLKHAWGWRTKRHIGVFQLLKDRSSLQRFSDAVRWTPHLIGDGAYHIDAQLADAFRDRLLTKPDIQARFESIAEQYRSSPGKVDWNEKQQLLGDLRTMLASSCIEALEPDLIILDEFQRFRHLLDGQDPAADLARHLFEQGSARVLLLSATPYKMYTLPEEADANEDHYADFLRVTSFLMGSAESSGFDGDLRRFRQALQNLTTVEIPELSKLRGRVERRLRRVMSRTERLAETPSRMGMLKDEVDSGVRLEQLDLDGYLTMSAMSRLLDSNDPLEYWKSAPYLLNFMDNYKVKQEFRKRSEHPVDRTEVSRSLGFGRGLLSVHDIEEYKKVDPSNSRLRALIDETVGKGTWRLLWLPPALPYYRLEAPFEDPDHRQFTKRLVFSAWSVVPQVIASMVSYEADRLMVHSGGRRWMNTTESRSRVRPLLRFQKQGRRRSREDGGKPEDAAGYSGMSAFALLYPSPMLARVADPLQMSSRSGDDGHVPSLDTALDEVERKLQSKLKPLVARHAASAGPPDESWYWVAPLLLDARDSDLRNDEWLAQGSDPWLLARASGGDGSLEDGESTESDAPLLRDVIGHVREVATGRPELGQAPEDLARVLARLAIGSPAVCALRSLARASGSTGNSVSPVLRNGAARIAWGFRTLFNIPEVMALLRGPKRDEDAYWQRVLDYCLGGCLQAVLEEYLHVLVEDMPQDLQSLGGKIAGGVYAALTLRAPSYQVEDIRLDEAGGLQPLDRRYLRCRYALRFGTQNAEDAKNQQRAEQVRFAFNSPFWPFVLATTSVGQEGLDFHRYCHAVVHWNLPTNPVDLEQREGRVHRYKGHAVRKNVARQHSKVAFSGRSKDAWISMFAAASRDSPRGSSDIIPFWVYRVEGGAFIERYVPLLPLSREVELLARLKKSVTIYRLVFGQPRQEDLLDLIADLPP